VNLAALFWRCLEDDNAAGVRSCLEHGFQFQNQGASFFSVAERSALNYSAANGKSQVARVLVEAGAPIDSDFFGGNNVLHEAIRETHGDLALYFLKECQADARVRNAFGNTALHLASLYGQSQVVYYLVDTVGMDPEEKNGNGATSIDCAFAGGQTELIRYFMEKTCKDVFPANAPKETVNFCLAQKFLQRARKTVSVLSLSNVYVLPVNRFLECGKIPNFQDCIESGWLKSAEDLDATSKLLFISHRWETEYQPDPNNTQYLVVVEFLQESTESFDYVWVDYSCIIQDKASETFQMQLSNIPAVLFFSTHCLVVPVINASSISDLKDFLARGWSQLETIVSMFTGCDTYVSFKTSESLHFLRLEPFKGFTLPGGFRLAVKQALELQPAQLPHRQTLKQLWGNIQEPIMQMKQFVDAVIVFNNAEPILMEKVNTMTIELEDIQALVDSENTFLAHLPRAYNKIGDFTAEADRLVVVRLLMFCIASGMYAYLTEQ